MLIVAPGDHFQLFPAAKKGPGYRHKLKLLNKRQSKARGGLTLSLTKLQASIGQGFKQAGGHGIRSDHQQVGIAGVNGKLNIQPGFQPDLALPKGDRGVIGQDETGIKNSLLVGRDNEHLRQRPLTQGVDLFYFFGHLLAFASVLTALFKILAADIQIDVINLLLGNPSSDPNSEIHPTTRNQLRLFQDSIHRCRADGQ